MSDRKRGSIVDVVNLTKFEFDFEPVTKERQRTNFAKRDVIGRRLSNHLWVGCGDSELQLEIFLLGPDTDSKVALLKSWLRAQSDTGAPHPFYINIGSQYVGKRYLLLEVDN